MVHERQQLRELPTFSQEQVEKAFAAVEDQVVEEVKAQREAHGLNQTQTSVMLEEKLKKAMAGQLGIDPSFLARPIVARRIPKLGDRIQPERRLKIEPRGRRDQVGLPPATGLSPEPDLVTGPAEEVVPESIIQEIPVAPAPLAIQPPEEKRDRFAVVQGTIGASKEPATPEEQRVTPAPAVPRRVPGRAPPPPPRPPAQPRRPLTPEAQAALEEEARKEALRKIQDAQKEVEKLRARLDEIKIEIPKYITAKGKRTTLGKTSDGYQEFLRLSRELGAISPQDALTLVPGLTAEQRATLSATKVKLKGAAERLEQAKQKARDLGIPESEIAKLLPAPEAGEARMEAALEVVERPKEPEKLKKWLGLRLVGRMAFEMVASVLAVNAPRVTEQYVKEKKERGKITEEINEIMKTLEASITTGMRAAVQEGAGFIPVAEQKVAELQEKVDALVKQGKITEQRRDQILGEFAMIILKSAKDNESAQNTLVKDSTKTLNDYLEKKISKLKVANEWISTGLVATQQYMARGIAMLGLATLDTTLKQKREYELDLRAKVLRTGVEAKPGFLEKLWEVGAKRVIAGSVKEYGRLWAGRPMEKVKALLTTARWVAVGSAAYSEYADQTISNSVEYFLEEWQKKGPLVLLDGFPKNVERIFHLTPTGERGHETLEPTHKDVAHVKAEEGGLHGMSEAARQQAGVDYLKGHGVIRSLVDHGRGEMLIDEDGHKEFILNLDESHGGFGEVQQGLRRLFGQYVHLEGNRFKDADADRLEKMIKLATHLLGGEKIPSHLLDKGFEIPANFSEIMHYDAHGNVEIDMDRFQTELAPALEKVADHYHVSMMAYINNTGHRVWQKEIMDARMEGTGTHIAVDDFDKSLAVQAHQQQIFNAEAKALSGADVHDVHGGLHESSGNFKTTIDGVELKVAVYRGHIHAVTNIATNEAILNPLGDANAFDDPLAQAKLHEIVETQMWRTAEQVEAGRAAEAVAVATTPGGGAVEGAPFRLERGPILGESHSLRDVLVHAVEKHGQLEIGGRIFKAEWVEPLRNENAGAFAKDPLHVAGLHVWNKWSEQGKALRALAEVIKKHPDTGTLEEFAIKHEDRLDDWMREAKV